MLVPAVDVFFQADQQCDFGAQAAWVFSAGQGGARRAEDTELNTQAA